MSLSGGVKHIQPVRTEPWSKPLYFSGWRKSIFRRGQGAGNDGGVVGSVVMPRTTFDLSETPIDENPEIKNKIK